MPYQTHFVLNIALEKKDTIGYFKTCQHLFLFFLVP